MSTNAYIESGELTWDVIGGWWTDAGTYDGLLKASNLVAGKNRIQGNGEAGMSPLNPES